MGNLAGRGEAFAFTGQNGSMDISWRLHIGVNYQRSDFVECMREDGCKRFATWV